MADQTEKALREALKLVRAGKYDRARPILTALLKEDPSLAQAWFLLSYTLPEKNRQVYALQQALRADPAFERAQERLTKLLGRTMESDLARDAAAMPAFYDEAAEQEERQPAPEGESEPEPEAGIEKATPRDEFSFVDNGEDEEGAGARRGSPVLRVLLSSIILFVVVAAVYTLAGDALRARFAGTKPAPATATQPAAFRTLPPTWTPEGTTAPSATPTALPPTPTPVAFNFPAPNEATLALMDEIRQEVLAIRGLPPATVTDYVINRDQAVTVLETLYLDEETDDQITREQQVLVALDLVPADYFLREFELSSQVDQLGGFYVPTYDSLFVISEDFSGMAPFIYAHEYEHALADEHFGLEGLGPEKCTLLSDACRAALALIEGDATALSIQWLNSFANEEVVDQVLEGYFENLDAMLVQSQPPPPFISLELSFPYAQGEVFASTLTSSGGWAAIDAAYADPPTTTEQILHPEKYTSGEVAREQSAADLAPALDDAWEPLLAGSLGEWLTYLLLWLGPSEAQIWNPEPEARAAAAGWGSDRFQSYRRAADGAVLVAAHWLWDSPEDADEMWAAMAQRLGAQIGGTPSELGAGQCWADAVVSCAFVDGDESLWLQAPDAATIEAVLALYPQFE